MSDSEARGDEVYQPQPEDEPSERQPDMDDSIGEPGTDALIDQGYSPPDWPFAKERGDSLDERLARELPEGEAPDGDGIGDLTGGAGEPVDPQAGGARAGRLAPTTTFPHENNVFAYDVGIDAGAASAEEAAMHVIEDLDGQEGEP
ncbi:DUF5709 domain-containing protein [Streptomyces sp. NBC_01006]|uniref:DUF5709 domain-containing protein n=1 Tax=Streptomyces sp. NBC_01006 TaxID=2903716 RepID=UPI00386690BE|nr:DUF5709 domain-containing protein [Streptomyces sp. NBC_01006]